MGRFDCFPTLERRHDPSGQIVLQAAYQERHGLKDPSVLTEELCLVCVSLVWDPHGEKGQASMLK